MTMAEKIEAVLNTIPYEAIRNEAFEGLLKDGVLKGEGHDIEYMCMEQVDLFKLKHMRKVKAAIWEPVWRQIRKVMAYKIKEYTQKRFSEEAMKDELETVDIGDVATA